MTSLSLATFHLFFVASSALLGFAVAAWGMMRFSQSGDASGLVLGALFLVTAVVLVVYRVRFKRKLEELERR